MRGAWGVVLAAAAGLLTSACSSSGLYGPREPRYTIIKPEDRPVATQGIPPDKEAEIQLLLQQREPSAKKCYQDVLDEKKDRAFQGTIRLVIAIDPSGRASSVKVVGGTLGDRAVSDCLAATVKEFEFPALTQPGEVQYEYQFRPAY